MCKHTNRHRTGAVREPRRGQGAESDLRLPQCGKASAHDFILVNRTQREIDRQIWAAEELWEFLAKMVLTVGSLKPRLYTHEGPSTFHVLNRDNSKPELSSKTT